MISIIVPVYNTSKYLRRSIDSILNQTYKDIEIILVDDGSTDDSPSICDEYAKKNTNIHVIHKENAGLGYARNSGMEIMHGEYVMFVDSDDYIKSDMVEILYNELIKSNSDTVVGGFTRVINNQESIQTNPLANTTICEKDIRESILLKILGKKADGSDYIEMSACKTLYSTEIIKNNSLKFVSEREIISEDLFFNLEYYSYSKSVFISGNCGYCYCDNPGSLTTKYRSDRFKLFKKMTILLEDKLKNLDIYDEGWQRVLNNFIANVRHCLKIEVEFKKVNGKTAMINNIKKICDDEFLNNALSEFDDKQLPLKSKIINYFIKTKRIKILLCIMHFKLFFNI